MYTQSYTSYILRLGLGFVFLWFGFSQLFDQSTWVSFIPTALTTATGISASTFVIVNAMFEIFCASLLVFGIYTRVVASLLFVHMIAIVADVGLGPIGIRDIGLMVALFSIALQGKDEYSLE